MFMASGFIDNDHYEYDGYVPKFISGGDYVNITLDLDTMKITNLGMIKIVDGVLTNVTKEEILKELSE